MTWALFKAFDYYLQVFVIVLERERQRERQRQRQRQREREYWNDQYTRLY